MDIHRVAWIAVPVMTLFALDTALGSAPQVPLDGSVDAVRGGSSAWTEASQPPAETTTEQGLVETANPDWWSEVQKNIAKSEYQITRQEPAAPLGGGAYQAPNRAQNFRTCFTEEGIRVFPRTSHRDEAPAWEWGLAWAGWGRNGGPRMQQSEPTRMQADGNRIEYHRQDLVEWYVNTERGLEQGFTIAQSPDAIRSNDLIGAPEAEGEARFLRLDLAVTGTVRASLDDAGQAVDFLAEAGASVIRFDHLQVIDAKGRALPGWFECSGEKPASQLLSIVVDDTGAEYPITIDPLATSPAWTAESNQAAARFGVSAATAGDVDGDGFSDVIVGAYRYDNGDTDEGRVFVYLGSAAGLGMSAAWTAESNQAGAELGFPVATAGDVNGDGFSDVIVGALLYDAAQTDAGRAFVYHGSATGLSLAPDWTADGDQGACGFGHSATVGDVNGDGYSDVIVGAANYDNGEADEGRVFVYHGSQVGLSPSPAWSAESDQAGARFGAGALATAGDVNGDGYGDVIVGALYFDHDQVDEGRAFVYHGSSVGLSAAPAWTAESDQAGALFGVAVAGAGDLNGDGYSDVIVGAATYDRGQADEGCAFVWHGSSAGLGSLGTPSNAAWTAESDQAGAWFGREVGVAGDVNGDGYAEVIVGALFYDDGEADEGGAFLWHGGAAGLGPDGTLGNADWSAESDQMNAQFGVHATTAGDVNGDGYSDVLVSAYRYDNPEADEGRVYVYLGSAAGPAISAAWTVEGNQDNAQLGFSVDTAGDVNGDGFSDVVIGAPRFDNGQSDEGMAFVYHGSASGLSPTPSWSAEGNQASGLFGQSVAAAGDVNGDGFADVVIGAPTFDNVNGGRALAWYGGSAGLGANGTPDNADWFAVTTQSNAHFASSVAGAGDVNGDGFGDVIVGAKFFDTPELNEGQVYVYHGSATGLHATEDWTADSDLPFTEFGYDVGTAGDVNGDGYSDVIVGAPSFTFPDSSARVYVFHGSSVGLSASFDWMAESQGVRSRFGISAGTAGDVNGDGFSDVVAGTRSSNGSDNQALVYHGSPSGLPAAPDWLDEMPWDFSARVATAGDVNGDGFSDVVTSGNQGGAHVYHGSATGLSADPELTIEDYTGSVASAGDVNGDGYGDVLVGAPTYQAGVPEGKASLYYGNNGPCRITLPRQIRTDGLTPIAPLGRSDSETEFRFRATLLSSYGRTRLQMEHEVKPFGVSFDGLNTVTGAFSDIGSDGEIAADGLVSGLATDTQYHWRVRPKYDLVKTPFQPNGPWLHVPINGWNEADLRTAASNPAVIQEGQTHDFSAPFELLAAGRNPGGGRCGVELRLNDRACVQADVVDILGRSVAILVENQTFGPGSHLLKWDGRDHSGSLAATGVYFIRVRAEGETRVRKAVLIR